MEEFISEILDRNEFLSNWVTNGAPKRLKLCAVLNHNALMTALIQVLVLLKSLRNSKRRNKEILRRNLVQRG